MARSVRSKRLAAEICRLLAEGKSLRTICAKPGMPARSTVLAWLLEDAGFAVQYARAREAQAEILADEIVGIADRERDANRARVRIDARKWAAGKLRPRRYGDRGEGAVVVQLPEDIRSPDGLAAAAEAILRAACAGAMTPTEAQSLAAVLETRRRAVETEDLARRLELLEGGMELLEGGLQ